jgi:immunoglobulin-like protein involved in spore germination/sporulation and spore germination protein
MNRLAVLALIALACTACGQGGATVVSSITPGSDPGTTEPAGSQPASSQPPGSDPSPPPSTATATVQTWYTRGETLWFAMTEVPKTPGIGAEAVKALIAGPSDALRSAGVGTTVPPGTQFLGLDIADGIATVDLSSEFAAGGGTLSERMRLAQLVYTLNQFETVRGVRLKLDGQLTTVFSGDGIVLRDPMRGVDFQDLLPVILVETPAIGQTVSGPLRVTGTANVFEANLQMELRSASGKLLAKTFTTATCGTGCRGAFDKTIEYTVDAPQQVTLIVHDDDAAGTGTPPHQVVIPLTLEPASD